MTISMQMDLCALSAGLVRWITSYAASCGNCMECAGVAASDAAFKEIHEAKLTQFGSHESCTLSTCVLFIGFEEVLHGLLVYFA